MEDGKEVFTKTLFNVQFLKTDPRARYQGYTFFFKEGFCWTNVLTTYIKCRQKQKTVQSTESMSFFSVMNWLPEYYMICIINSRFAAYYIDSFVNTTSHCTTGDAKLIPIIIPNETQLKEFKVLFNKAIELKKRQYNDKNKAFFYKQHLNEIQIQLDIMVNNLYSI